MLKFELCLLVVANCLLIPFQGRWLWKGFFVLSKKWDEYQCLR